MGELLAVDQVAYVRFASVYGQFTNVDQFLTVITEMLKK
jgi:transcriptional regulator NrdR family protein